MDEDDYQESSTTPSWPDLIDPVPTFWPTSNWWGSIDPIRNHDDPPGSHRQQQQQQSRHSNRIPTYAPTNIGRTTGSSWSTNNQQARSSSSRPAPYFQLLLAGLVQVRSLVSSGRKLLVVVVVLAAASLILQIRNINRMIDISHQHPFVFDGTHLMPSGGCGKKLNEGNFCKEQSNELSNKRVCDVNNLHFNWLFHLFLERGKRSY